MSISPLLTARHHAFCILRGATGEVGESKLGRLVDALALGGDEGRDKLR